MAEITLRQAQPDDAGGMAEVQNAIFDAGLRKTAVDEDKMRSLYLEHPNTLRLTIAEGEGEILGFQWLGVAWPDNEYGVATGWGMIGTHIRPDAGRIGIGRRLFAKTLQAARIARLAHIDASIGDDNAAGLAYYQAMGFRPYRKSEGRTPHRLDL
ncbi:GNAT family N-acetyltransferase [Paracoccus albus]|uniref:GNAT family N-acetyltransferase n=1 Tax=Paracoccus albus TaxID=3017784 RepID=UPI0022F01BCD|nr:GNAT family N-acetyltransferase [Paracoccus albus]WBU60503.1 GNAT family N-acetyltransferase [Paracoccus albus]